MTAVDFLEYRYKHNINLTEGDFIQAKQMEQKQHEETWFSSRVEDMGDEFKVEQKSFEDYYNETYGVQNVKTTFTRAPKMIIPNSNGTTKTLTDLKIYGTI